MGWLFHCNTGMLRKHKLPPTCFVMPLDNYVTIKACNRMIEVTVERSRSSFVPLQMKSWQNVPSFQQDVVLPTLP